ncbi:hydroxyisourate hydrolase [Thiolinea disciformis]|uniref:hydroxyisourate hydrolase n=1 Tax=Thiolinea disciformis TaxID=125614 RepID=UPI00035E8558|nr:hydroxyisourate hydrolase [Thiolinea disciformis]
MGKLTTHVLDTANGCPAANVTVDLYALQANGQRHLVKIVHTNQDGRCNTPLLEDSAMSIGTWELVFYIADYFKAKGHALSDPAFFDVVPLRFAIADPNAHYHVPLLVSPWSYSTYRGS